MVHYANGALNRADFNTVTYFLTQLSIKPACYTVCNTAANFTGYMGRYNNLGCNFFVPLQGDSRYSVYSVNAIGTTGSQLLDSKLENGMSETSRR